MAKYEVHFSCGHTATIDLVGTYKERQARIQYLGEKGVCPDCYSAKKAAEYSKSCEIIEMHYGEYCNKYHGCKTVDGSYNKATKTIKVYVPRQAAPAPKAPETPNPADDNKKMLQEIASFSKSQLFKRAHQLARQFTKKYSGTSYSANFSICLKELYAGIQEAKARLAA